MKKIRDSVLIAGVEQSGKTYFAEQFAQQYIKRHNCAVIYNVGKDDDFAGAEICTPIPKRDLMLFARTKQEQYEMKTLNHLPIFRDEKTNKIIKFENFSKFYKGKTVKIYRTDGERYLFKSFFLYLYDSLIILDDNRAATKHGLAHEQIELFSRKNHAGLKYANGKQGVDIFFIYHNLDTPPAELYDYLTRVILFRLNRSPNNTKFNTNPELYDHIVTAIDDLKTMEKYSKIELILQGYPEIKRITHTFKSTQK